MNRVKDILLAAVMFLLCGGAWAADELEKNFITPPDSAKPSCSWWWLNAKNPAGWKSPLVVMKRTLK